MLCLLPDVPIFEKRAKYNQLSFKWAGQVLGKSSGNKCLLRTALLYNFLSLNT